MTPSIDHKIFDAYPIGMVVMITKDFFGHKNTVGVVYEHYQIGRDHVGVSIINENGDYDGFSVEDLEIWEINPVRIERSLTSYVWKNVGKLSSDFNAGLFNKGFKLSKNKSNRG